MSYKTMKRQKILDKIQQKKTDLFELKKINLLTTDNEGNLFNGIFNDRDVEIIGKEIIAQEVVLNMVESVVVEITDIEGEGDDLLRAIDDMAGIHIHIHMI
jgi:hypothetical protein